MLFTVYNELFITKNNLMIKYSTFCRIKYILLNVYRNILILKNFVKKSDENEI